ncbi:glycosyltransferase family 2 protein [Methanococcoides sp. NM1]|uniref:glycosyltransferase family 2 protein n=1 Tax=Methanococcoides sp. NM1 TaxID=1201013 RepID=UPI0010831D31|nr:glycosyltransferase family 2 protein [Methanococcoides sp. NM1]
MNSKNDLKITVITVVYNDIQHIEETINSVIDQTYDNVEYVIIDGGSTDGTVDVIKKYEINIDYWISEPDKGIYDAMNKGILKSTGDYVHFLNSGDTFYDMEVISKIVDVIRKKNVDLIYGKSLRLYENYKSISPITIKKLKYGIMPSHQATFVDKSFLINMGCFDLQYKSSSDFDFYCRSYLSDCVYLKLDIIIANFLSGGFSSNKAINYFETFHIIEKYFGKLYAYRFYFFKIILEQGTKKALTRLGLIKLLAKLIKINNKRQVK